MTSNCIFAYLCIGSIATGHGANLIANSLASGPVGASQKVADVLLDAQMQAGQMEVFSTCLLFLNNPARGKFEGDCKGCLGATPSVLGKKMSGTLGALRKFSGGPCIWFSWQRAV